MTEPVDHHGADLLAQSVSTVTLKVPADVSFVTVVRSLAASLAARCSLTIDEIEDLRIAVDEACALLVMLAVDGTYLDAVFTLEPAALTLVVDVQAQPDAALDRTGFGWTVLDALAEVREVRDSGGGFGITLSKAAEEATGSAAGAGSAL